MTDIKTQETVSPSLWRGVAVALPVSLIFWWVALRALGALW